MTRQEYMQQLAALLAAMPEAERRDALDYYEEYFDAAGPEKEAQTIQELGSPQNVADQIWEGTGAQSGTPMPDNSMPEQGSRRRKSLVWIVLAILAILIVVLLVFIGSFKIVTKYQYSIAESATAEEVPPQEATGGATENIDESTDENTETAITKESAKSESTNRLESSTMTLDAKQVQTMVLDLDCGEVAFVRSNAADEITLRFENFYSDWLERTVDESGFSVRYKIPKGYISGSDPTPTLSIALPEIELEQIELNLNLGSADLGTLKAKSIQADLALGSLYADELQTGQLDATLALGSAELGTVQAERVTIENAQGDVTISRLVGASQVQVTDQLGNIALTLGEKTDGYSVQAACGLGSITVSGAKQASPYSANSKAANAVILDAALGDITLNFEE
ncbi:MAG: HAAS signaling domain-containing protein [Acutalibacteraceae bacterium]